MRTVTAEPTVILRPSLKGRAVHLEGGLFGPDFLERLEAGDLPGQRPADFGIRAGRSVVEEAAEAYRDAQDLWKVFRRRLQRLPEDDPATSLTREGWVVPLLGLLDYELQYNPKAYDLDGVSYAISHRAGQPEDAPPVHIVGTRRELGRVDPTGRPRLSPHTLLQEFLNRSEHLWGIVTNGRVLRLLRKSPLLRRQAYVEFDLEAIFDAEEGERFSDFLLLYRLLHRTRLPQRVADAGQCWLERYHQDAQEQGNRARDRLRDGVEECLTILGTGFLRHSRGWEASYAEAEESVAARLYADLLRLVYRFLFLLVAEERGLLGGNDLYREHYSVGRLRRLTDRFEAYTEHDDLWQSLRVLWHLLRDPTPQVEGQPLASFLGLPVLDGGLFEPIPLESLTVTNRDLLRAFFHLAYYYDEEARTYRRVNYAALDVEELGSVYESLLDNHPVVVGEPDGPAFRFTEGTQRKSTGSYYTPPELVQELIRSALAPVLEEKLRQARDPKAREQAILSIKVLDPACGSGHFLLAAGRRLGRELARVRTGEDEPSPEALREATRDIIAHCVYGVDKNPLAVELCKVALWIESHVPGKPLTFLDHHIRTGDSLLGVVDLSALREGIPDEAYEPVEGHDRGVARALKKRNAQERAGQMSLLAGSFDDALLHSALEAMRVDSIRDDTPEAVAEKARRRQALWGSLDPLRRAANLWTAAFFQEMKPGKPAITTEAVGRALERQPVPGQVAGVAEALAHKHRFFHWPLEFPEVFADGGFDVVLANPPWERIKLQEQEFFGSRDRRIADAPNAAARKRLIAALSQENPELWQAYLEALHAAESTSRFLRGSSFYPFTGRGRVNTYSVFAERMRALLKPGGRMGIIVPTGIATDDTNKHLFAHVVERGELVSLYDFENSERLFPAIAVLVRFSLFTIEKAGGKTPNAGRQTRIADFAFFLRKADDLEDPERSFTLTPEDFCLLNPNTRTAPIFRTRKDAELTKHIYRRVPVLVEEAKGAAGNPWGVKFLAMFHMANDAHLFRIRQALEDQGFQFLGNVFVRGEERYLPLYEAKLVHQFDHRFATYTRTDRVEQVPLEAKQDPGYEVLPRYWVAEAEVEARLQAKGWDPGWLLGWRDITNATNERTAIAAVIPRVGVGDTFLLMFPADPESAPLLLGMLDSVCLDYSARQKLGGTSLKYFTMKQLPFLPPSAFERPLPFPWEPEGSPLPPQSHPPTVADFVRPRVLELTYTAWDLKPFAEDLGYDGPPFPYDPERRFWLRAELDALFFLLYLGTPEEWAKQASPELKALFPSPQEAMAYILDQFPIVRRREEEEYGEYRTKKAILELYEQFLQGVKCL